MSKNSKTLIFAFLILAALGGAYYLAIARANKKVDQASIDEAPAIMLGNLESSKLTRIEVPGLVLVKSGENWNLNFPGGEAEGEIPQAGIELDQRQIQLLTFYLASVWVERIDESPVDISVYGLDNPSAWAMVTDAAGKSALYYLGNPTPSGNSCYIMEEGDPGVYSVSAQTAEIIRFSLNDIRQKLLFPQFELRDLTQLRIEEAGTCLAIGIKPETVQFYTASSFSTHVLTSPYLLPRGISGDALRNLLMPFNNLFISEFINDGPLSLDQYGLDKPVGITVEAGGNLLNLQLGSQIDGKRYAKLAETPGVFTLGGLESLIGVKPLSLIDRLVLLVNIETVEHLLIAGGERNLNVDIFDQGYNPTFFINGKKAEEQSFREFYQTVIGLFIDAEYPGAGVLQSPALSADQNSSINADGGHELTIEYRLNTPPGEKVSITLLPYNRDFYALRQGGAIEFLISRNQVRRIFEAADAVVYE